MIFVDGVVTENLEFAFWKRQHRIFYSALIDAIYLPVQSVISSATIIRKVWNMLAVTFGTLSRVHIGQLKYEIRTCTKETKTINEYVCIIKYKTNELVLLGKPIDPEDLLEIIDGLGEEYKAEIDAIHGQDSRSPSMGFMAAC